MPSSSIITVLACPMMGRAWLLDDDVRVKLPHPLDGEPPDARGHEVNRKSVVLPAPEGPMTAVRERDARAKVVRRAQ
jgi:hypothetical protein